MSASFHLIGVVSRLAAYRCLAPLVGYRRGAFIFSGIARVFGHGPWRLLFSIFEVTLSRLVCRARLAPAARAGF